MRTSSKIALAGAGLGAAFVVHGLPGLGTVASVRRALLPGISGIGSPGHVALTFDDGPDPKSTPHFLDALDELGWKATFFMLGLMAQRHPDLARRIAGDGHEIALHGYEHRSHLWRGPMDVLGDMRRGLETLADITGAEPRFFRPPYGVLTTSNVVAAKLVGLQVVLWTSWGRDWRAEATPETVVADLDSGLCDGATLLLHDSDCTAEIGSWRSAVGALPALSEIIAARNWSVGPLCEHFGDAAAAVA